MWASSDLNEDLIEQAPAPVSTRRTLEGGFPILASGNSLRRPSVRRHPHLELVESMKFLTEVTKADVCTATVAMSLADGLEDSPLTVLSRAPNEDFTAAVSLGSRSAPT